MTRRLQPRTLPALSGVLLCLAAAAPAGGRALRSTPAQGDDWVALPHLASALGLRYSIPGEREMRLEGGRRFSFEPGGRKLLVDGQLLWLNAPTLKTGRHWAVSRTDAEILVGPLARPAGSLRGLRARTIALDPGHGGRDTGAIGPGGTQEKALALDLARRVRARLDRAGFRIVLTREGDRDLDLSARAQAAQRQGADLFVSLHFNAAASPAARGVETHVLASPGYPSTAVPARAPGRRIELPGHRHGAASTILGYHVQRALVARLEAPDRGVRRSNFAVLRAASFPAILVECGFLSHPPTERLLRSEAYMNRIADAIAEGILAYAREVQAAHL